MNRKQIIYTSVFIFSLLVIIYCIKNWRTIKHIWLTTMDLTKYPLSVANHLNKLNEIAKPKFAQFIDGVIALGYKPQINSSYRSFAEQQTQYNANPSNAKPGYSYHNYGLAIDMQMSKNGVIYGKNTSDSIWLATGVPQLAKSLGLTWGGDNSVFGNYQDAVHFDWRIKKTSQLLAMAKSQFGTNPEQIKGNELLIV